MAPYVVNPPPEPDPRRRPIPNEDLAIACVPFVPWRCHRCRSTKPRTYGQRGRVRFHFCRECDYYFRSIEIDPDQLGDLPELRGVL